MEAAKPKLRLDKWLWQARFFKTRSLSAAQITGGHVRVNGTKVLKSSTSIAPGDVLTFTQAKQIRVIQVDAIGIRRGPAPEAQALYTDMSDPAPTVPKGVTFEGKGRPTKRNRRDIDLMRRQTLE